MVCLMHASYAFKHENILQERLLLSFYITGLKSSQTPFFKSKCFQIKACLYFRLICRLNHSRIIFHYLYSQYLFIFPTGSRTKPSPSEPGNPVTTPTPDKGQCPREGKITAVYYSDIYKQEFAFTENHKIHFLGYKNRIPTVNRFSYYPKVIVPGTIEALFTLEGFQRFGYNKDKYQFIFNDQGK